MDLRLGSAVVKAETTDAGLALTLADGTRIEADRVLLASGCWPGCPGSGWRNSASGLPGQMLPLDETCRVVPNAAVKAVPSAPAGTAPGAPGTAGTPAGRRGREEDHGAGLGRG